MLWQRNSELHVPLTTMNYVRDKGILCRHVSDSMAMGMAGTFY